MVLVFTSTQQDLHHISRRLFFAVHKCQNTKVLTRDRSEGSPVNLQLPTDHRKTIASNIAYSERDHIPVSAVYFVRLDKISASRIGYSHVVILNTRQYCLNQTPCQDSLPVEGQFFDKAVYTRSIPAES